eukprot:TRINITY_DN7687_c1_g6_i1.p1 TRINITY_DN7687_c1_g6~~TRINITY_DN7687_c1_g6_i1.p1  ORF type:complete len:387 (+),score=-1.43 TRINITY_DN7687_c1_g6_i1:28-1161(+)
MIMARASSPSSRHSRPAVCAAVASRGPRRPTTPSLRHLRTTPRPPAALPRQRLTRSAWTVPSPLELSDSAHASCDWYARTLNACSLYGLLRRSFFTAREACCVCGGGVPGDAPIDDELPQTPQCADLSNGDPWRDISSDGCELYRTDQCSDSDSSSAVQGEPTANEACCSCGGGTWTGTPTEVRLWDQMTFPDACDDLTPRKRDRFAALVQTVLKVHARVDIVCDYWMDVYPHFVIHALIPWDIIRYSWFSRRLKEVLLKDPVLSEVSISRVFKYSTPCGSSGALSAIMSGGVCNAMLCERGLVLAVASAGLVCATRERYVAEAAPTTFVSHRTAVGIIVASGIGLFALAVVAVCLLRARRARSHPRADARNEPIAE